MTISYTRTATRTFPDQCKIEMTIDGLKDYELDRIEKEFTSIVNEVIERRGA